ncbi:hypothetical protein H4W79_003772 [Nocardiopsis terrae]|uniref:Secreted protein n=1 Tax=Nocardiopsis terrae TaxID=372655 RepID=A0ABR9HKL3_9ACTN|nr:hypothetical protein [Nocardiopsis terrae]MBE1459558.1 hypothetical protein [Nocardiopsis terrae]
MSGHTTTHRLRALAAPLVGLVVLCFLCALCHPGAVFPEAGKAWTASVQGAEPAAPGQNADSPGPAGDRGSEHACPAPDEQGLLTANPVLAPGSALVPCVPDAPRAGPSVPGPQQGPAAPYGCGLLTLLCVQRV